ncbi:isoprenoid biosynthesis glyoxalase ElbB [Opacimonas viscosa]|uniref:Glyoxalase n=1 Tax=Opacimonas viscosa TaxID=2961944 RepID=A0AA42BLR7_9ALTE|nr:isoprenoid biosynthesis glyoxalase ElbB [Opacimonas viscosa]MCP3429070.1 isoprenoid biosynthesis glyoxalase ElbB [Opacimonas viscosa]
MSKHIAVILSGCGVYDGAEINEVVLTLLHLEKQGAIYTCFAPNIDQFHVINHLTGESVEQTRNVLEESARIVRGNVQDLALCQPDEFAGLIIPGGFGVAKNLSDFAVNGTNMQVFDAVAKIAKAFKNAGKVSGYMCIAPALAPHIFGKEVQITIGHDADTANALETMGATHCVADVGDIVIDETHNLVTTPAYMLAENIAQAETGIRRLVEAVLARC